MLVNIKRHSSSRLWIKDMNIVWTALLRAVRYFWLLATVLCPHSQASLPNMLHCWYFCVFVVCIKACGADFAHSKTIFSMKVYPNSFGFSRSLLEWILWILFFFKCLKKFPCLNLIYFISADSNNTSQSQASFSVVVQRLTQVQLLSIETLCIRLLISIFDAVLSCFSNSSLG